MLIPSATVSGAPFRVGQTVEVDPAETWLIKQLFLCARVHWAREYRSVTFLFVLVAETGYARGKYVRRDGQIVSAAFNKEVYSYCPLEEA
jgi:hypothetical protein